MLPWGGILLLLSDLKPTIKESIPIAIVMNGFIWSAMYMAIIVINMNIIIFILE